MRNKSNFIGMFVFFLVCIQSQVYSVEISDVDGTWVYDIRQLTSPRIHSREFSWGTGKTIPNTTLNIDIEEKFMTMVDSGGLIIDKIWKEGDSIICINVYHVEDKHRESEDVIKFHFESNNKTWIECPRLSGRYEGKEWPWYRLSGPSR
jgi:hypothetical protein